MKKIIITMLLVVLSMAFAKEYQDVVRLKNGSVIRGIIVKQIPSKSISIETKDGNLFVYQMDEIEEFAKEEAKDSHPTKDRVENIASSSDHRFYIKGDLGYNFGMGGLPNTNYNYNSTSTSSGAYSSSEEMERVNCNLGEGMIFKGTFGYMFNANIGTELAVGYQLGSRVETEYNSNSSSSSSSSSSQRDYAISSNMLIISPSLLICFETEAFKPYCRLGLSLGFGNIIETGDYTSISTNSNNGTPTTTRTVRATERELTGGMAFGLNAALGSDYKISNNLAFFAEINLSNLSYTPTEGEYTKYDVNGVDQLAFMTTAEKETEFVDSYTDVSNPTTPSTQDPNSPSKSLKISFPYHNAGLRIGLKYSF